MVSSASKPVRILVADQQAIYRRGLCALLGARERFEIVGSAERAEDVRRKATELRPDLILLDLSAASRVELLRRLSRECPASRILALGEPWDAEAAQEVMRAGAAGYLLRSAADEELWRAVETVCRGETYLSPASRRPAYPPAQRPPAPRGLRPLTGREREVMRLIAEGLSNKEAAATLAISVRTVENHRANIMKKLDLRGVVELVRYAISTGLVRPEWGR